MATRRKQPKRPKSAKARAKARSAAAKKGWVTRRYLANPLPVIYNTVLSVAKEGGNYRAVQDALITTTADTLEKSGKIKTFAQARLVALRTGATLHGMAPKAHKVLESMITNDDERWLYYLDLCEQANLDMDDARDYWFSPEI